MSKIDKFINKSIPVLFNLTIFFYLLGGFAAPFAQHLDHEKIAELLYWIYHFFCHQKPERSFFIFGEQMAFCSRDLAIFASAQLVGIYSLLPNTKLKRISKTHLLVLILPLILDGGVQLLAEIISKLNNSSPLYESTNLMRVITGTMFGIAMGNIIFGTIEREFNSTD